MDVRLKSNVVNKGVVLTIGTTFSLSDKEASDWIERGLAEKITVKSADSAVTTVQTNSKETSKKKKS